MTDKPKTPLTETAVDRKLDAAVRAIQEAQAKKDAEQDAKLRPSVAMAALKAADFTVRYPVASSVAGLAFIAGGVALYEGTKMWTLVVAGFCLVPGLAAKAIEFVAGIKKAKE
jgi:hypothetical protein